MSTARTRAKTLRGATEQLQKLLNNNNPNPSQLTPTQQRQIISTCTETIIANVINDSIEDDNGKRKDQVEIDLARFIVKTFSRLLSYVHNDNDTITIIFKAFRRVLLNVKSCMILHDEILKFSSTMQVIASGFERNDINALFLLHAFIHVMTIEENNVPANQLQQFIARLEAFGFLKPLIDVLSLKGKEITKKYEEIVPSTTININDLNFWREEKFRHPQEMCANDDEEDLISDGNEEEEDDNNNNINDTSDDDEEDSDNDNMEENETNNIKMNEEKYSTIAQYLVREVVSMLLFSTSSIFESDKEKLLAAKPSLAMFNNLAKNGLLRAYLSQAVMVCDCETLGEYEDEVLESDFNIPQYGALMVYKIVEVACQQQQHSSSSASDLFSLQWLVDESGGNVGMTIGQMLICLKNDEDWFGDIICEYEQVQVQMARCIGMVVHCYGGLENPGAIDFACRFVRQQNGVKVLTMVIEFLHELKDGSQNGYVDNIDHFAEVDPEDERLDGWNWISIIDQTPTFFLKNTVSIESLYKKLDLCDAAWDRFHGGEGLFAYDMNWIISTGKITCSLLRELIEVEKNEATLLARSSGKRSKFLA
jgi:hypothetical protein